MNKPSFKASTRRPRVMAFKWEKLYNGLVYVMTSEGCAASARVAAFDLDWTLIGTRSGNVFPKDPKDWRFLYEARTVEKVRSLHQEGFKVVVISNQSRLTSDAAVEAFKVHLPITLVLVIILTELSDFLDMFGSIHSIRLIQLKERQEEE